MLYSPIELVNNFLTFSLVRSRSMDEEGMEEDGVSCLHLHVSTGHRWIVVLNAVIRLVHAAL